MTTHGILNVDFVVLTWGWNKSLFITAILYKSTDTKFRREVSINIQFDINIRALLAKDCTNLVKRIVQNAIKNYLATTKFALSKFYCKCRTDCKMGALSITQVYL